jgi:hypothetical protein
VFAPTPGVVRVVQFTRELQRIVNLPRRVWEDDQSEQFALDLTAALRRPEGSMTLRPIQAAALFDAGTIGGLVGPIGVGEGKTLISGLAPKILNSRRPLLLTRAALVEKTKREFRELAYHWPIPNFIRIMSYELLGRTSHADALSLFSPDFIFADEAHKLKNPKAAVTKRVARYMAEAPGTKFAAVSGTFTKRSLLDYAHLVRWALGELNAPMPMTFSELADWAEVIDEKTLSQKPSEKPIQIGALAVLCTPQERAEPDTRTAARKGFERRFEETPGVVASDRTKLGCSLMIQGLEVDVKPITDDAFDLLRGTWTTPDGWPISDPMTLWRHARELALGFYYKWDPRPPDDWLSARKEWAALCREILTNNRRNLDSELQVVNATDQGHYPEAKPALDAWRRVKPLFTPNTVPVWIDDSVIDAAARWAMAGPGIIWTEHTAFAERLAWKTNLTYYGRKGLDKLGRDIEQHDPAEPLIASINSVGEGRNLQAWDRNLYTSCSSSGIQHEQTAGRTHRLGQRSDEVTIEIVITCLEHVMAFEQARRDARYEDPTGRKHRLNFADIVFPTPEEILSTRTGARWIKKQ